MRYKKVEIKAYAKINLALDVKYKRDDGYHEMDMIMMPITLHDTLHVTFSDCDEIVCNDETLEINESNTIYQAITLMRKQFQIDKYFKVVLDKKIPTQAGLAGGSADGAAMLKAINELCQLQLTQQELIKIGVQIGADIPFCLVNKVSRVKGIGEQISEVNFDMDYYIVLVKPQSGVSTKEAFANIDFNHCEHPVIDDIEQKMIHHDPDFAKLLKNTLEQPSMFLNKEIKLVKEKLNNYNFDKILMSGSGSCVFALTQDYELAQQAKEEMEKQFPFAGVFEFLKQ